ncbi:MAG TPA: hypothetical protein VFC16_11170 [Nakamurella sp.]|nr:hypothetical protein [Nakamurella sp.]
MSDSRPRFSTQVSELTQARARATVRGIAHVTNTDFTLSRLVEDALDAYCTAMEAQYHGGKPWPVSDHRLRPGARLTG